MGGLVLQSLVSIDDLFGTANIRRAARQYTVASAQLRPRLVVPASAELDPRAEVDIGVLIPGVRMIVAARGQRALMRLTQVDVSWAAGEHSVKVTLETVNDTQVDISEGGAA